VVEHLWVFRHVGFFNSEMRTIRIKHGQSRWALRPVRNRLTSQPTVPIRTLEFGWLSILRNGIFGNEQRFSEFP